VGFYFGADFVLCIFCKNVLLLLKFLRNTTSDSRRLCKAAIARATARAIAGAGAGAEAGAEAGAGAGAGARV
jgi:hypothetical protein